MYVVSHAQRSERSADINNRFNSLINRFKPLIDRKMQHKWQSNQQDADTWAMFAKRSLLVRMGPTAAPRPPWTYAVGALASRHALPICRLLASPANVSRRELSYLMSATDCVSMTILKKVVSSVSQWSRSKPYQWK